MSKWIWLVVLVLLMSPMSVLANSVNNEFVQSPRAQAMGNALIALVDDGYALMYNPAGLARGNKMNFRFLDINAGISNDTFGVLGRSVTSGFSLDKLAAKLKEKPVGNVVSGEAHTFPYFQAKNIGVGIFGGMEGGAWLDDATTLHYRSRYVGGIAAGVSIRLFDGRLKMGYAAKYVDYAVQDTTSTLFSGLSYRKGLKEGKGFAHDAGIIYTFPMKFLPAISGVVRNIGGFKPKGSGFFATSQNGVPDPIDMSYDVALAMQPFIGKTSRLNTEIDFRDVSGTTTKNVLARLNAGMEMELNYLWCFRVGLSRGYPTAGLGIKTSREALDFTMYSEEMTTGFRELQDRRFVIRYSGGL